MEHLRSKITLTSEEIEVFNNLYSTDSNPSIFQNFEYNQTNLELKRYFYLENESSIQCYLIVIESNFSKFKFIRTAKIISGPIGNSIFYKKKILKKVIEYYKKRKFSEILYTPLLSKIDLSDINEIIPTKQSKRKTGTLFIELNHDIEKIKDSFSNNIKKNIKKGINKGIITQEINTNQEIEILADIHVKMSEHKSLNHYTRNQIINLLNFITKHKQGFITGCYIEKELIGGIACIFQGDRIEYFIGISDPEHRKLPINHLSIYNAIINAKEKGFSIFDMGGIVLNANINDQLYSISEFKKDFSKNIIKYGNELNIVTNIFYNFVKQTFLKIFNLFYK